MFAVWPRERNAGTAESEQEMHSHHYTDNKWVVSYTHINRIPYPPLRMYLDSDAKMLNVALYSSILDSRSIVSFAVTVQNVTFYLRLFPLISDLLFEDIIRCPKYLDKFPL